MRSRIRRYRWAIAAIVLSVALLAIVGITAAQPPIPHGVLTGDDCLSCHEAGVAGARRLSRDHIGRRNEDCTTCHEPSGALAIDIPHPVEGRQDCISCHSEGIGTILPRSHLNRTNDMCLECHLPSPSAAQPTPTPPSTSQMPPIPAGEGTCATCHQRHLTEEEHGLFTSQPIGDAEAGAASFAELCESCHGEDGTTAVGDQGSVISSEAYLSTHDDADILKDIGIGSHGEATAFAQEYGGPLSWEEILDLAAFVRSWGSYSGAPSEGELTYPDTIAPLLAERCGECHGGIAGLTVTDYESVMTGGDSGPAVVPGSPDESPIVEVQREGHYAQLSEMELNLLIEWIAGGALER